MSNTALRSHSIFQLLGISPDENQEEDLKIAELGTLRQLVIDLKDQAVDSAVVSEIESKITALETMPNDTFTTELDALYIFLAEKFPEDLNDKLEKAVAAFKQDILIERVAFLKQQMSIRMEGIFGQADDMLKKQEFEELLPYLQEIQTYLQS